METYRSELLLVQSEFDTNDVVDDDVRPSVTFGPLMDMLAHLTIGPPVDMLAHLTILTANG